MSTTILEQAFTVAMRATYDQAVKQDYIPTRFMQMLDQYGGVGTAQRLLAKHDIQEGIMRLWELKQLDSSMETIVLKERFASLFTEKERAEAHRRLAKRDYF